MIPLIDPPYPNVPENLNVKTPSIILPTTLKLL
jgi:hypothetical protein